MKKPMKTESTLNQEICPHFSSCSQNFCPLDPDLALRSGNKQDKCRWMREPKQSKINGREFVSGGSVMPDALLKFMPESNLWSLNTSSQKRWYELSKA